jgi:hypothetical protein
MLSFSLIALSSIVILGISFYLNIHQRKNELIPRIEERGLPDRYVSNVSTTVARNNWGGLDIGFAKSLKSLGKPLVLKNTIASQYPRYTLSDISKMLSPTDNISSFFKHDSEIFGPYYDAGRPMHRLLSGAGAPYESGASLRVRDIEAAFTAPAGTAATTDTDTAAHPFYSLSISPEDLGIPPFNTSELISLYPQKSSMNLWLGMKGGTTPCHYDGYHNMYVQLSGHKKFLLLPPGRMRELQVFPFLHPSYGQCGAAMEGLPGPRRDWLEVTLRPGELLYIPPFWLHEVVGVTPSVAFNVWTGIADEEVFQEILAVPMPCLESGYDPAADPTGSGSRAWGEGGAGGEEGALFRPHYPLYLTEMSAISTRLVLGSFLIFEALHRINVKELLPESIRDVYGRYTPLIDKGVLTGVPAHIEESISRTIEQWMPKPYAQGPAVWGMAVADKPAGVALAKYTMKIAELFQKISPEMMQIWATNYVEAVALQVGGVERASWLIDLVGKKIEREVLRRQKRNKGQENKR